MGNETSKTSSPPSSGRTRSSARRGDRVGKNSLNIAAAMAGGKNDSGMGAVDRRRARSSAAELPPSIHVANSSASCNESLLSVNAQGSISQQQICCNGSGGGSGSGSPMKLSIDASACRSRSGSASSYAGSTGGGNKASMQLPAQTAAAALADASTALAASSGKKGNSGAKSASGWLNSRNRQLIQGCFQNPHESLGKRIMKRAAEKRKDVAKFYVGLTVDQREELEDGVKQFLKRCVANIDSADEVQRLAEEFGARFVQVRAAQFKADYFSTIADSTITECAFLDNAVHPAHQTLSAFSQFITTLFSSVRDGFYTEMRRMRRTSNSSFSTGSNSSSTRRHHHHHHRPPVGQKLSNDSALCNTSTTSQIRPPSREMSPRSLSPGGDSAQHSGSGSGGEEVDLIEATGVPPKSSPRNSASSLIVPSYEACRDDEEEECYHVSCVFNQVGGKFRSAELLMVPGSKAISSGPTKEAARDAEGDGQECLPQIDKPDNERSEARLIENSAS